MVRTKHYDIEKIYTHRRMLNDLTQTVERQLNPEDPYPLNINELRNYFYYGYGNDELRAKSWQIFLNYFVKNKFKSKTFLVERRSYYHEYKLCTNNKNEAEYYDDIIDNDMTRKIIFPITGEDESQKCEFLDSKNEHGMMHRDVIKRILITFRKTNSSIGYVQGMCHLLLPIYYVFATDKNITQKTFAEEDSYFCFFNLISEIGDFFMVKMDNDKSLGIKAKMKEVFDILHKIDGKLFDHLEKIGIIDSCFNFRWVSLLLTLEFSFAENIWLWDRFLSDCKRFEMVTYCSAAILELLKEDLIMCNFDEAIKLLQSKKKIDPQKMWFLADETRRKINKP